MRLSRRRLPIIGVQALSVLVAVATAGLLVWIYLLGDGAGGKPGARATTDVSESPVPVGTNVQRAVDAAVSIGRQRGVKVAVVVRDRHTGMVFAGGDLDHVFYAASVVKVLIATRLLVEGSADRPDVRDQMRHMIVDSDDAAATALYPLAGGDGLAAWIRERYQISGLSATTRSGSWGLTQITGQGVVDFYTAVADDPLVGPWLLDAMGSAAPVGSDGFDQDFGLMPTATHWRVKQGWLCCTGDRTTMHSTGYIDHDRYAIALLTEGGTPAYGEYGRRTVTLIAQALLPAGTLPVWGP